MHSEEHECCGHTLDATLGDLLEQPDYAGLDYEDGCLNATVVCKVPSIYYVVTFRRGRGVKYKLSPKMPLNAQKGQKNVQKYLK